ncbi:hypothetical protein L208DRAFT_184711 [Tricholoma matsutake]|nr:hypothetical protein L208DRAFT_184711 [Tricholoma matsutake 945]
MTFGDAIQERYLCTKCRRNLVASNQFDTKPEANIVLVGYRLSFQHIFRICLALLSGTAIQFWMDSCMQATPPIFPPHLDAMRLPYLRVFGIFISRVFLLCMSDASPPFELPFAVFRLIINGRSSSTRLRLDRGKHIWHELDRGWETPPLRRR